MNNISRAIIFATEAHGDQKHEKGWTPYVLHPLRLIERMRLKGGTETQMVVAALHDVIEDTDKSYGEILAAFGYVVADAVSILTRRAGETYETYIDRIQNNHLNYITIPVKLMDLEDNMALGLTNPLPEPRHTKLQSRYKWAHEQLTNYTREATRAA